MNQGTDQNTLAQNACESHFYWRTLLRSIVIFVGYMVSEIYLKTALMLYISL